MFYDNLKKLCDERKTSISAVAKSLNLDKSIGTTWKRGVSPTGDVLIKLSNKLDCSVDYLLGRTANSNSYKDNGTISIGNVSGNSGAIGVGNIVTNNVVEKSEQAAALLDVFNNLDPVKQAKLLVYADELSKT